MGLKLKTAPTVEPITATEAKLYLRIDGSDEDSLIDIMIAAARQMAEEYTGRAFITQTWTMFLDKFPSGSEPWWDGTIQAHIKILNGGSREIMIPRPPLQTITHIKTYNDANTATTYSADNYIADAHSQPGRIVIENAQVWPSPLRSGNAIEIEFICGYGLATAVPAMIKQAIYIILAKLYECRGEDATSDIPLAAKRLLAPFKVVTIDVLNPQPRRT